jgi:hypothetical protein
MPSIKDVVRHDPRQRVRYKNTSKAGFGEVVYAATPCKDTALMCQQRKLNSSSQWMHDNLQQQSNSIPFLVSEHSTLDAK